MKKQKGCFNRECDANKTKTKFNMSYKYCPFCKNDLQYVCRKRRCYALLPITDKDEPFCPSCIAKDEKLKEKRIQLAKNAITVIPTTIVAMPKAAEAIKEGIKVVSNEGPKLVKEISKLVPK